MAFDVSTRAYLLAEGRVVMEGAAQRLAKSPEVREAVLGL
jgi:ABC-type branched-subunit amino acid transport system ATPase component